MLAETMADWWVRVLANHKTASVLGSYIAEFFVMNGHPFHKDAEQRVGHHVQLHVGMCTDPMHTFVLGGI